MRANSPIWRDPRQSWPDLTAPKGALELLRQRSTPPACARLLFALHFRASSSAFCAQAPNLYSGKTLTPVPVRGPRHWRFKAPSLLLHPTCRTTNLCKVYTIGGPRMSAFLLHVRTVRETYCEWIEKNLREAYISRTRAQFQPTRKLGWG